ncbi:MAG TPA: methylated-DNA--[protein]-cysteine S-methyltransferase, partial [Candidatus Marinimicrobia bacterium]|nr:methylated-DNA--[protein]-cysteine S-methyltransferase [Candidatus Neomarinimicrobiota bacterium]
VAMMVSNFKASRSVGSANAKNPLPLYFPCHRIISYNGGLGGYGGGLGVKKYLLDLEAKNK